MTITSELKLLYLMDCLGCRNNKDVSDRANTQANIDCLAIAQLFKALAAPTHVNSCVQEVQVRSRTSLTLASIPAG